ncbi:MAG: hypothetical protein FJ116_03565 [Deltaproteobacteria bacterium]|nr:hypothetical protein [Deltaproteobacteria bacterium]MBM4316542.1 hypothetical protein [Deltaproteobacteria bacterium]
MKSHRLKLSTLIFYLVSAQLIAETNLHTTIEKEKKNQVPRPSVEHGSSLSGIQFNCSEAENKKLTESFKKLFEEYDWIAPWLVTTRLSKEGTQFNLRLHTASTDTSTIDLFNRPEFKIRSDQDKFTDRQGNQQNYEVASEKEIIASMLQNGRLFQFDKSYCRFEKFMEHVQIRKNIIRWGVRAMWKFPEDGSTKINPKFWNSDWTLKPNVKSSDAIADAFAGQFNYEIGCTKACQKIMAQGILDYFKHVKTDKNMSDHLDRITAPSPLNNMEMTVKGSSRKDMVLEGTLVDRHFAVPADNWVPGDWGWIKNTDDKSAEENGYEGCNIVYIGRGKFVVYYESDPDRTLDEALVRVYRWRDNSKEKPIDADLVKQIRKDPRDGGLLRDVRDFPKNFPILPSK